MKNLYRIEDELYIVSSSEKVKENTQSFKQGLNGDWFYNTIYNFIVRTGDITPYDFKIILTTNRLLIADGVQAIDDEFLEWFVKNPSCDEVEIIYGLFNAMGRQVDPMNLSQNHSQCVWKYKIIIPKEELSKDEIDKFFVDMVCSPKQEAMYGENDMIEFVEWCMDKAVREFAYGIGETKNWELRYEQRILTTKELLELWKNKQVK